MNKITNNQTICDELVAAAEGDKNIIVCCSDSRGSGSMTQFADKFPAQFVELGIAEQNLVSVSAGLAACGKRVFAVSPACFLSTRSYEQAKVDVAYAETSVVLVGISGGVSYGALGMTHHSLQDIAAFSALPGVQVYLPSDRFQTRSVVRELLGNRAPAYLRISRGASVDLYDENTRFSGGAHLLWERGNDVLIVACGETVYPSLQGAKLLKERGIAARVIDVYRIKPFPSRQLLNAAAGVRAVVCVEEHSPFGGLGSITAKELSASCPKKIDCLSLPDGKIPAGTQREVFEMCGITATGIAAHAEALL